MELSGSCILVLVPGPVRGTDHCQTIAVLGSFSPWVLAGVFVCREQVKCSFLGGELVNGSVLKRFKAVSSSVFLGLYPVSSCELLKFTPCLSSLVTSLPIGPAQCEL
ncbi:hypothetical protein EJ08DRAFT_238775 [Tothia fuscella]|uniref:Uncharacterized protein n=1 Tax=Tothia fuscella TaxID=1048955 RepID=A0A9P4NST3_9PEZI|nr:hypothetical protein EJ08DRAFT_238775 [Tothia fuscella]